MGCNRDPLLCHARKPVPQAFVPATTAARPQRRARVVCAAQQSEGTSRRAALQQAAGLAATLFLSRQVEWHVAARDLGVWT